MHNLIKKRAQERKLEKEKAEKAQLLAEAWIGGSQPESGNTVDVPTYAPIPSDVPSRASSGPFTENGMDGDATDHSKTEHRRKLLETFYIYLVFTCKC